MAVTPGKTTEPLRKPVGILTFVFKYGLIGWGFGSGIAYIAMEYMRHAPNFGTLVLWAVWFFPLLGMAAGFLMWLIGRVFSGKKT